MTRRRVRLRSGVAAPRRPADSTPDFEGAAPSARRLQREALRRCWRARARAHTGESPPR